MHVYKISLKKLFGGVYITEETCMICSKKINIDEHPRGLVFKDKHFVCQDCNKKHTPEEVTKLSKTVMQSPITGMPIALWLIHEQNKNKTMMTMESKKL